MKTVIGVKFRGAGKTYWFDPQDIVFDLGEKAVVETSQGVELADVVLANREVDDSEVSFPLRPVLRKATEADLEGAAAYRAKEEDAAAICERKIENHGLEMKLVRAEYAFDGSKIVFYFTADGRIDFRELVRDLAGQFKTRIELRQIGVRDESRMLGGIGMCGREFCCKGFLSDFQPVSIKMAKVQGLSLNPVKISGACGRLMCCLKYEQDVYEELSKEVPPLGAYVSTPEGEGIVVESSLLTGKVKVSLSGNRDAAPVSFGKDDIIMLSRKRPKPQKETAVSDD